MSASTIKIIDPGMALKPNIEDADLIPYWSIAEAAMVKLTYANLKTDIIDTTSDDTEILFNNAGILDGDPRLTYNPATNLLTVPVIVFDRTVDSQLNAVSQTQVGMVATIPDLNLTGAQNFVFENFSQTLTEKTINDLSNIVHANAVHVEVFNITGSTLNLGQLVYVSGYNIGQDLEEADLADATSSATMPVLGLVGESIATGQSGRVRISGRMMGVDTSSFSVNDGIYATTTPGVFGTKPTGINELVQRIGIVLRSHATLGVIEIVGAGRENDNTNSFASNTLKIKNPADTFAYTIVGDAIAADRNVTLPLLTGNDVFVTKAFAQILTNKTFDSTSNVWRTSGTSTLTAPTTISRNTNNLDLDNLLITDTLITSSVDITGSASASFLMDNVASTDSVPTFLPNKGSGNTGVGGVAGAVSLITAGNSRLRVTTSDIEMRLTVDILANGSSAIPSVGIGQDNDGFYRSALNEISLSLNNVQEYVFGVSTFTVNADLDMSANDLLDVGGINMSGNIDMLANGINNMNNITFRAAGGTLSTNTTTNDKFTFRVYDTNAPAYRIFFTATANPTPTVVFNTPTGGTLNINASNITVDDGGLLQLGSKADPDPTGTAGDMYFNTTSNNFRGYDGTSWTIFSIVGHTHAAADVISGTFLDARISQSSVKQHEAALTILESQITDGSILARIAGNETISGNWIFSNELVLNGNIDLNTSFPIIDMKNAGGGGEMLFISTNQGSSTNKSEIQIEAGGSSDLFIRHIGSVSTTFGLLSVGNGNFDFNAEDAAGTARIDGSSAGVVTITTTGGGAQGAVYAADYSSLFTDRSIIDRGHVKSGNFVTTGNWTFQSNLTISTVNIVTDTTTGSKIGTSATQKLGFWNATPIIQPLHITDPTGGGTIDSEARTAINAINALLASTGLSAAA